MRLDAIQPNNGPENDVDLPGVTRLLHHRVAHSLVDGIAVLGASGGAEDVTDGEALLVLGDLQPCLTDLLWDLLAVEVRQSEAELVGEGGAVYPGEGGTTDPLQPGLTLGLGHRQADRHTLRHLNLPTHLHLGLPALHSVHLHTALLGVEGTLRQAHIEAEVLSWLTLLLTLLLVHCPEKRRTDQSPDQAIQTCRGTL